MNAEDKLARHRLSVLELAEQLGNVREACRQRGMSHPDGRTFQSSCPPRRLTVHLTTQIPSVVF